MKLHFRRAICAFVMCLSSAAQAGESGPGAVIDLQVDGNRIVFGVTGPSVNKPACATWSRYVFEITANNGPAMYAFLLSAQAAHKNVKVYGTNTCSIAPDHETASSLRDG